MGISLEHYRASIGVFVCSIKEKQFKFPSKFFKDNHSIDYGIRAWSQIRYKEMKYIISSRNLISGYIACSVLIHMLLMLCGDVHPHPGPTTWLSSLSICHANIRSIRGQEKFSQVSCELGGNFDIITLSESWLSNRDKSNDYRIAGYQSPFRRDRADNSGYGGVMAYVSSNIACKRRDD